MRVAAVLTLALVLVPSMGLADDRPICGEAPSDAEVRQRLAVLREHVRQEEPAARRWFTSFAVLHSSMLAASVILATSADTDEGRQIDLTVGAISSSLALITLLTTMPPLMGAGGTLDGLPRETPEQRLHAMREAEDILRRDSNAVEFVSSWLPATGTALYTVAAATTLLVGFDRWGGAFSHVLGGIVLGHGRLLLRPTGSRSRWRRYRRQYADAGCERVVASGPQPSFRIGAAGPGLGFSLRF